MEEERETTRERVFVSESERERERDHDMAGFNAKVCAFVFVEYVLIYAWVRVCV